MDPLEQGCRDVEPIRGPGASFEDPLDPFVVVGDLQPVSGVQIVPVARGKPSIRWCCVGVPGAGVRGQQPAARTDECARLADGATDGSSTLSNRLTASTRSRVPGEQWRFEDVAADPGHV